MVGGTENTIWLMGLPFITSCSFGPGSVESEMEAALLAVSPHTDPHVKSM